MRSFGAVAGLLPGLAMALAGVVGRLKLESGLVVAVGLADHQVSSYILNHAELTAKEKERPLLNP